MLKILLRGGFALLVLNVVVTLCDDDSDPYGIRYHIEQHRSSLNAQKALNDLLYPTERGIGLSAWGIVAVAVAIVLAIIGMYYISICYPVFCDKPKKYDVRSMPPPV